MKRLRVSGLFLGLDEKKEALLAKAARKLNIRPEMIRSCSLYRKSVDARGGGVKFVYVAEVTVDDGVFVRSGPEILVVEKEQALKIPVFDKGVPRPVVVGFGPGGMFCALVLARAGLRPIVLERGKAASERQADVERFLKTGALDPESNVQFGEGGAGTFSDGKLNTLVRDKENLGRFVLETLVACGAPEEILWENKPHVGTDHLKRVVENVRREILRLGGEVRFQTRFIRIEKEKGSVRGVVAVDPQGECEIPCEALFLAPGHSARDVFFHLREILVPMEKKTFSVGVRIEHKQAWLNDRQYGAFAGHPKLPAADYKLAVPTKTGKTLYSFCMCPGGVVIPATSTPGAVVTNGMSDYARDGENANAALLVGLDPKDVGEDLFSGFQVQKRLEETAYRMGGSTFKAPAQTVGDFLNKQKTVSFGSVVPSYARGVVGADLAELFPVEVTETLRDGLTLMDQKLRGFAMPEAVLTGPESRSTCPVRILRNVERESELGGLFPVGEGAGYAGGITSAAMDGIKSAMSYLDRLAKG